MDHHDSDTERFKQEVIRIDARVQHIERLTECNEREINQLREILHKIDVEVEGVKTNLKTISYLLMLIVGGLISIAFSLWQGGGTP